MSKIIKIINDELVEIASYRNPEIVFHDSNNPRRLEPEYDNFESYCDFKVVINPFELYAENQQLKKEKKSLMTALNISREKYNNDKAKYRRKYKNLKKQKDDVVEYIKEIKKHREEGLTITEYKAKWRSMLDYLESDEIIDNLLRMLGEIDE